MAADIKKLILTANPTGGSGASSDTVSSGPNHNGYLLGVYIAYTSAPATTDVTIKINAEQNTILTLTNVNTSGFYSTMNNIVGSTGAAVSGVYTYYPLSGPITLSVAQADVVAAEVVATFYIAPN